MRPSVRLARGRNPSDMQLPSIAYPEALCMTTSYGRYKRKIGMALIPTLQEEKVVHLAFKIPEIGYGQTRVQVCEMVKWIQNPVQPPCETMGL